MAIVPWWALLSSGCAPLILIGGWAYAATLQPAGYDPMTASISALAADGAAYQWLMAGALALTGVCHMVTAFGLRAAAKAGRVALACGGLAAILVALSPEPAGGTSLRHMVSTGAGFTALALFPVLAAERGALRFPVLSEQRPHRVSWTLRPVTGYVVTALMGACAIWFLIELHGHGDAGLVERLLTGAQSVWPLFIVVACVGTRLRTAMRPVTVTAGVGRGERSDSSR
jgi:hypothetical membrane protein